MPDGRATSNRPTCNDCGAPLDDHTGFDPVTQECLIQHSVDRSEGRARVNRPPTAESSRNAALFELDADEREAMDYLLAFMAIVTQRWGLRANHAEMASAVHVLQGFVTQHMLARRAPEHWGNWWGARRPTETPREDGRQ